MDILGGLERAGRSIVDGAKRVGRAIVEGAKDVWEFGKKAFNWFKGFLVRILGVFDWGACVFGYRPKKYARVKVYIVQDSSGPVATTDYATRVVRSASDVFEKKAKVFLTTVNHDHEFVEILPDEAPSYVVNAKFEGWRGCGVGFNDADEWFREHTHYLGEPPATPAGMLGVGETVYLFVVRSITEKGGYAVFGSNYCVVEADRGERLYAHELGHQFGLPHTSAAHNLMKTGGGDEDDCELSGSQICWLRNSRFVTYTKHGTTLAPKSTDDPPKAVEPEAPGRPDWGWILLG